MNSCYNDDIGASFLILQLPWVTQNTHLHTQFAFGIISSQVGEA